MSFFRRLFRRCEHDFKNIDSVIETYPNYDTGRYESVKYYILYCPKCDKEKRVNAEKYDLQLLKERVKREYE